jgi:MoaA/NifB/PqqE/SkfB family radical SAM enzyme
MIVVWRITERCNLSCPFCAYDRTLERSRQTIEEGTTKQFGRTLAQYQSQTGDSVLVSWLGGEPFLFPRLSELTVFFKTELGLRVSATTNGTMLNNSALREHILNHYAELTVSVDGVGPVHDELRGWPGGYASLRQSVRHLAEAKRASKTGPVLRANVLMMRQTVRDFERLCIELADWGIEEITFNQLGGRDRPAFFPEHRLSPEDAQWLIQRIPALRARLKTFGVHLRGSEAYLRRIDASSRSELFAVTNCDPGEQFIFIDEHGTAAPCHFTVPNYGIPISELNTVEKLCRLPTQFARAQREHLSPYCADCHSTRVFEKFAA